MTIQDLFLLGMVRDIPELLPMPFGLVLNLGAGLKLIPGTVPLDWPQWNADNARITCSDNTVAGIHAYHFLEHCENPIKLLIEMDRVLRVGGVANIVVPYYTSQMQAQDLDHKARFCEMTWDNLFRNKYYKKYDHEWRLRVHFNLIIGVVERNLCLMTQLVKF